MPQPESQQRSAPKTALYSAQAHTCKILCDYLIRKDYEESKLNDVLNLKLDDLDAEEARVDLDRYYTLWREAVDYTGKPDLALRLAARNVMEGMGLVGHVFFNCKTLKEALEHYKRYYQMGKHLAAGRGYIAWSDFMFSGETNPTAVYPPLYPFLLSLLQRVGITTMDGQHLAVAILGAINIPLVACLGHALAGRMTGVVAGGLAAISPAMLEIDGSFMAEALYVPLVGGALLAAVRACAEQTLRAWMITGALFGLAALARTEALLFLPVLALPLIFITGGSRRWLMMLGVLTGFAVFVLPWTARNAAKLGAFVPVSQNYGGGIHGANCGPTFYDANGLGGWNLACIRALDVRGLTEVEAMNRRREVGIRYAMQNLEQLPAVGMARLQRTWGVFQPGRWYGLGEIEYRNHDFSRRTWFCGWFLLALAPVGMVLVSRRSLAHLWVTLTPFLVVSATTLVGYGNPRFRAAAEPLLVVLAALCIAKVLQGRPARDLWRAGKRAFSG